MATRIESEVPAGAPALHRLRPLLYFLLLLAWVGGNCEPAGPADAVSIGAPVTLSRQGSIVGLANGIVSAAIDTTSARVTSLLYNGRQMINQTGRHKTIYFFVVGDRNYEIASPCTYSVTRQTPDIVDVSCKRFHARQNTKMHPWDLDTHFVLRRGASGLYVYSIARHSADYPDLNIAQYLMIWPVPYSKGVNLLEKICVDDLRNWELPALDDFTSDSQTGIKEISKLDRGLWKGRFDCKYMYNAEYRNLGCWGFASDRHRLGAWVVFGSHEFFNDGPTMSDLTSATSLLHVMFNMNHYGGTSLKVPRGESWQKIFGPYLLYCNSNPGGANILGGVLGSPGIIEDEDPSSGKCTPYKLEECKYNVKKFRILVRSRIKQARATPPRYIVGYYVCLDWVTDVIGDSQVRSVW